MRSTLNSVNQYPAFLAFGLGVVLGGFRRRLVVEDAVLVEIEKDLQRRGAAELAVDECESAIDFGVLAEVVDEAVLDGEPGHAEGADREQHRGGGEHQPAAPLGGEGEAAGDPPGEPAFRALAFGGAGAPEQQHGGGKEGERGDEGDRESDAHHPPEVDDRLDAAEHQRAEADDGGERGVQAGPHHSPHRDGDQVAVREFGKVAVKLAVAHREMDVHRDGDDEHQGQEVRRDHRDLPPHQAEHPDHQQAGVEAAREREHHPPRFAEDRAEHDHEEDRHPDPEDDEVVAHEGDHVVGDHRHPAEVQGAGIGEVREHAADGLDLGSPARGDAALGGLVESLDAVKLCVDGGASGVVETLRVACDQQPVSLPEQGAVRLVVLHREENRGGPRIGAHDDLGEHRACEQLRSCTHAVGLRLAQGAEVVRDPRERDALDVLEQRDVEDAGDRSDAGGGPQPVAQLAQPRERRLVEDIAAGYEGDDEQVTGRVAGLHLPQGLEVAVVLEQQRIGRGVELEVARLPGEEPEHREHQHENARGLRQHEPLVDCEQRRGHR